jgi:hypothetical protein
MSFECLFRSGILNEKLIGISRVPKSVTCLSLLIMLENFFPNSKSRSVQSVKVFITQIAPDPTYLLLSGPYIPLPTMLSNIPVCFFHFA